MNYEMPEPTGAKKQRPTIYSVGAIKSTTVWLSSALFHLSPGWLVVYKNSISACAGPKRWMTAHGIPIKHLRNVIRDIAHATFPSRTPINKSNIRIYVCPTPATSRNDLIRDKGDRFLYTGQHSVIRSFLSLKGMGHVRHLPLNF